MKKITKAEVITSIIEWFVQHEDVFNDCIEELDCYNGYLGDDRYYCMDELDELYCDCKPSEILARAFYGYDEDSYTVDQYGRREHDSFNPNRDYFRFNGYGNLVSADYKDYSDHIDHWAVEKMSDYRNYVDTIDDYPELSELFDMLENDDEDDENEEC